MKSNLSYILILIFPLFLISCSVKNIPNEYQLNTESQKGVVIVKLIKSGVSDKGAYINITTEKNKFIQNINFVSEKNNDFYALELPKGNYIFCDMRFHGFVPRKHRCRVNKEFKIKPGVVTFAGILEVVIKTASRGLNWDIKHDNTFDTTFLKEIEKKYSNIDICEIRDLHNNTVTKSRRYPKCN